MSEIEKYQFGMVYDKKIKDENIEEFSKIFGEGSPALTELIKFCMLNDIRTFASCKGHPEKYNFIEVHNSLGYIGFDIDNDLALASFLAQIPSKVENITAGLEYFMGKRKSLCLYVPNTKKGMSEQYFSAILEELKKYVQIKENKEIFIPDKEIYTAVKYIYSAADLGHIKIKNNKIEFYERNGFDLEIISKCQNYDKLSEVRRYLNDILQKPRNFNEMIDDIESKKKH